MSNYDGILVACEGVDGSGKSTLSASLAHHYAALLQNKSIIYTREPGGTLIGEKIRECIKEYYYYDKASRIPMTEFLLFAADRAQHIHEKIKPALHKGALIITDRFCDSSLIYQGYLQGLSIDFIHHVHRALLQNICPSITLYCRVSNAIAQERIGARQLTKNMFDDAESNELQKIIAGFDQLYQNRTDNIIILDAEQSAEKVFQDACDAINKMISAL